MPYKSKRRSHARTAVKRRWTTETVTGTNNDSDEESFKVSSQSSEYDRDELTLHEELNIADIGDLFEMVKSETTVRSLSVLMYLSLTHFGVTWRNADLFLKEIGALSAETCHKWGKVFIEKDLDDFLEEKRGGKHGEIFFDTFPELENTAKLFALEGCQRKSSSFTSLELAHYVDKQYYELTGEVRKHATFLLLHLRSLLPFSIFKTKTMSQMIRSERACRLDLRRWGCKFDKNTAKPYWAGHERTDVVQVRKLFVQTFLHTKERYYRITEGEDPQWIIPKDNPAILLCTCVLILSPFSS